MDNEVLGESERRIIQQEMFQLEDQKQALEEQSRYLFENALSGLFRIDTKRSEVLTANKELLRIFGASEISQVNVLFARFGIFDELDNLINDSIVPDETHIFSSPLAVGKEERMIQFSARFEEKFQLIEGAASDITSLVKAEKRMLEAIRDAEQANHAKSLFLANISHEIRTPLNGIVGFAELIQAQSEGTVTSYSQRILDESDRLMTLINQLLDISKIEANHIELDVAPFSIKNLIYDQVESFKPQLRDKGLSLKISFGDKMSPTYIGDSFRIGQIVRNLVSNAIKFTPSGHIDLELYLMENQDSRDYIRFVVSDTGIGIPLDKQEAVFEKFIQADSSIERSFGGTGLGVAICKELVELMGGTIKLQSEEGRGTTFSFVLPLLQCQGRQDKLIKQVPREEADLTTLPHTKILLVEDYKVNQDLILLHLKPFDIHIDIAGNGEEALSLFEKGSYDMIIMDVHMPKLSGLEATMRIREMEGGAHIPIMGMSASAFSSDREECRKVGMNDFLSKPVRRKKLYNHLYFWLSQKWGNDPMSEIIAQEFQLQPKVENKTTILQYSEFCNDIGSCEDGNMIIEGYLVSAATLMEEITHALDAKDMVLAHRHSHSLKGGALNIMAFELSEKAMLLESALKEPNGRDIMPLYLEVSRCLERVRVEYYNQKNE